MSDNYSGVFKKQNLDLYLGELAREYKKLVGSRSPAEIILIGGAAIVESYSFRDMTADVDAVISASSAMKDAINRVGDRFGLPNGWINSDFEKTGSYSGKLIQYSSYYRTMSRVLNVRVVDGEYLVAMKLRAFRQYKNDLSDVIGILAEHARRGEPISRERVDKAVIDLYGSWDGFPEGAKDFIGRALSAEDFERVFDLIRRNESESRDQLIEFQDGYPGVLNDENVDEVLRSLRKKKERE